MESANDILKAINARLQHCTPRLDQNVLEKFVASFIERRDDYLGAAESKGSPLYIIEPDILRQRAARIKAASTTIP